MNSCQSCTHFHKDTSTCRRYPPSGSVIITQEGLNPQPQPKVIMFLPQVAEGFLCGEWTPKSGVVLAS